MMEPPGSTLRSHSWPRQRIVGLTRKWSFAPDFCTRKSPAHALCKQCLCVPQIGGVKALGEPAVDRCEQLVGCGTLALLLPQAGEGPGGAPVFRPSPPAGGGIPGPPGGGFPPPPWRPPPPPEEDAPAAAELPL